MKDAQKKITNEINSPNTPEWTIMWGWKAKNSSFVPFAICINFIPDYQI